MENYWLGKAMALLHGRVNPISRNRKCLFTKYPIYKFLFPHHLLMLVIIALTYFASALLLELRATTKCEFLRRLSAPGGSWCRIHCPVALQQCRQLPGLD